MLSWHDISRRSPEAAVMWDLVSWSVRFEPKFIVIGANLIASDVRCYYHGSGSGPFTHRCQCLFWMHGRWISEVERRYPLPLPQTYPTAT